ncbi:MAG TPA: antibiotic biosynthesis monooxygenase family protein [Rhizomicrobium sp.]|nr:antibiotic biosynthesis monooxygenase family protein [Rhizomicrobium sp.]
MKKPANRRTALALLGAGLTLASLAEAKPIKEKNMSNADQVNKIVRDGGLLVVAEWEVKDGQAERVAEILGRYQPLAQRSEGVKLFLIARGKENPGQFLFYELFENEAAFAAHAESEPFKTLIAGEALALLAKRVRAQYSLI